MNDHTLTAGFLPVSQKILKVLGVTMTIYSIALLTSMSGMEIFGWFSSILVLSVLLLECRRNFPLIKSMFLPIDLALLGFFIVVLVGAFFKVPDGYNINRLDVIGGSRWVLLFILIRIGLTWIWSESIVRKVILVLMVLVGLIGLYAVWQYFNGWDLIRGDRNLIKPFGFIDGRPFYRAEGLFGSPMTFAYSLVLSICFPLAIFMKRGEEGWRTYLVACSLFSAMAGLLASFTRGSWLAVAGAFLVLLNWDSLKRAVFLFLLLVLSVSLVSMSGFPELAGRMSAISDVKDSSNTGRFDLWRANIEIFKENPLIGIGYGVNEELVQNYYPKIGIQNGRQGHAHNTYIQVLAGTGLFGFLFFIWFLIYYLRFTWRLLALAITPWQFAFVSAGLAAQIALHIGGLTECNFKDAEVNHQFLMILASMAAIGRSNSINPRSR